MERWPDEVEEQRWREALADAARRIREDRGVDDPWQLSVGWGALWAEYGERRLRVAGPHPDVRLAEELFEDLDRWAAFHRRRGPGRVLDRDRAVMAAWRARLPAVEEFWRPVVARVLRDVEATTDLPRGWRVAVREDEEVFPEPPAGVPREGVHASFLALDLDSDALPVPERHPLPFPEVWLETAFSSHLLLHWDDTDAHDLEDAAAYLAGGVQEGVIEEMHGAWPPCPRHGHPLEVDRAEGGVAMWTCPRLSDLAWPIGELPARPVAGG